MPSDAEADTPLLTYNIHPTILPRYTFLNSIFISAKVQLLKRTKGSSDWVACQDSDNVAPAAYLADTLWEKIDIYLNDKRVTSDNTFRYLTAYMSKRLSFNKLANETFLSTEVSYPDEGVDFDSTNSLVNRGFQARKLKFQEANGKVPTVNLLGMISHDLSSLKSPIIENVAIMIKLRRNSNEKLIHAGKKNASDANWTIEDKEFRLKILHCALLVRRPLISDRLFSKHQSLLARSPCIYPFTRNLLTWTQCNAGVSTYFSNELFVGMPVIPSKIFCVMQSQDRTLGSYENNFLVFEKPDHLVSIGFYVDSKLVSSSSIKLLVC